MAGKKKKKGKSKKSGAGATAVRDVFNSESTRAIIIHTTIIGAAAASVFLLGGAISGGRAIVIFAAASFAGLLTGFTGNPACFALPALAAARLGLDPALISDFPSSALASFFSAEMTLFAASVMMAASAARDGIKCGWFRYEPALLIPALGLAGMAAATWARGAGSLFYELFSGFFSSPSMIWVVAVVVMLFGAARWLGGWNPSRRHWLWSAAAGPALGFWVGYVDVVWVHALVVLLLFIYLLLLNEDEPGIAAGLPIAFAPLCGAKLFFVEAGQSATGAHIASMSGAPWALIATAAAGFILAHLWAVRLLAALPSRAARHIFFPLLFVSVILMMILL